MPRNLSAAAYGVPAALAALTAFWLLIAHPAVQAAHIATGYVAKTLCSCVFVDARELEACKADLAPGSGSMRVTLDLDNRLVRVRAGLISRDTAHFDSRYGCRLDER
ncbi:MAG: hypothetical protein WAW96_10000 [Alphaproteobacteria bacterium]